MTPRVLVCLFLCLAAASAVGAGPFDVEVTPPKSAREWEEASFTVKVSMPASESLVMAGVVPPEDEKLFRFIAGPVATQAEADGKQVWIYTFNVRFLKDGNFSPKPFKVQYFKQPEESDKKLEDAEQKPEVQEAACPTFHVKVRHFWKRMGFWYGIGGAFIILIALYLFFAHIRSKGGKRNG